MTTWLTMWQFDDDDDLFCFCFSFGMKVHNLNLIFTFRIDNSEFRESNMQAKRDRKRSSNRYIVIAWWMCVIINFFHSLTICLERTHRHKNSWNRARFTITIETQHAQHFMNCDESKKQKKIVKLLKMKENDDDDDDDEQKKRKNFENSAFISNVTELWLIDFFPFVSFRFVLFHQKTKPIGWLNRFVLFHLVFLNHWTIRTTTEHNETKR